MLSTSSPSELRQYNKERDEEILSEKYPMLAWYLGLGPGSHLFLLTTRFPNTWISCPWHVTSRGQAEITFVDASETGTKFVLGLVFDNITDLTSRSMKIFSGLFYLINCCHMAMVTDHCLLRFVYPIICKINWNLTQRMKHQKNSIDNELSSWAVNNIY